MIHYNSPLHYQKDSKFIPVGINSIKRMHHLLTAGGFVFVHKAAAGFVFNQYDFEQAKDGDNILPVIVVKLRKSGINGWMQAHGLRIRQSHADESVTKRWYFEYVKQVAPLVSDTDHLQGGYLLWKHFLKQENDYTISCWNIDTCQCLAENLQLSKIKESDLWSQHPDQSKSKIVLSMEWVCSEPNKA